jgi:tetratricopeptide (TPR) repeat protein
MTCQQLQSGETLEDYVLNRLSEPQRDAVERHIFECVDCFKELQALLAVRQVLAEEPVTRARPVATWAWLGLTAAAAGILLWVPIRTQPATQIAAAVHTSASDRVAALSQLAQVEPPSYTPPVFRGDSVPADSGFSGGMAHYAAGDFAGAVEGLRKAMAAEPEAPAPPYYLGICLLATGKAAEAIEPLRKAASLDDPAFTQHALFYLAKGYLALDRTQDARQSLEKTARLQGDLEQEARRMLLELDRLNMGR